mmetsp:Transcript_40135/g.113815  ORF Transcript_40135/g.113815 Transcript_40135/m.113815 type:complete len:220 (+) Transcript_40135:114-773(+)
MPTRAVATRRDGEAEQKRPQRCSDGIRETVAEHEQGDNGQQTVVVERLEQADREFALGNGPRNILAKPLPPAHHRGEEVCQAGREATGEHHILIHDEDPGARRDEDDVPDPRQDEADDRRDLHRLHTPLSALQARQRRRRRPRPRHGRLRAASRPGGALDARREREPLRAAVHQRLALSRPKPRRKDAHGDGLEQNARQNKQRGHAANAISEGPEIMQR